MPLFINDYHKIYMCMSVNAYIFIHSLIFDKKHLNLLQIVCMAAWGLQIQDFMQNHWQF